MRAEFWEDPCGRWTPSPCFFVSVDSKELSFPLSPLDATLVGWCISVASKGVRCGVEALLSRLEKWRVAGEGKNWAAVSVGYRAKKGGGVSGKELGRTER